MKSRHFSYWNVGPGLTITFAGLLVLILGGNGLLLWQFHMARSKSESLVEVSQQLIAVLRLQESLLAVHQRLDELARDQDAGRLVAEAEPLRRRLLDQVELAKHILVQLPAEIRIDPGFLPTLQTIETTLPSQLDAITALAMSGDWEAVRFRVSNELKPQEIQSSALVSSIDQQVSEDWRQTIARMESAQRRILLIVPISSISTFIIAFISARTVTRRLVALRLEERVEERTRIAREFHDTFLQTVQGCKLVVDHALKNPKDHTRMIRAVEQLSIWLGEATEQGRVTLNSLRTSTTEANGLAEAFRRAIDECRTQTQMDGSFSVAGDRKDMHPLVRDEVYRIGYEAIRNACTHSRGTRLEVSLTYGQDLAVRVKDNGVGIEPAVTEKGKDGHFGLKGMRERAFRIGGKLIIASSANSGTEVTVVVPGRVVFRKAGRIDLKE